MFGGKVAVVTGGGSGIGQAAAIEFARCGACVGVLDVNIESAADTVDKIERADGSAASFAADVSSYESVKTALDKVVDKLGRLDFAFNNAGIGGTFAPIVDADEDDWNRVIDVNLKGVWICMKHEIPHLLRQGGGSIVNMSSGAGLRGVPTAGAYVASKHGVVGLTKTAALEHAREGIRVNAVCPNVIETPMVGKMRKDYPGMMEAYVEQIPLGRAGTAEEAAKTVVWLCSENAAFISGHSVPIDGGYLAK